MSFEKKIYAVISCVNLVQLSNKYNTTVYLLYSNTVNNV